MQLISLTRRLRRDTSGLALLEFGFALPIVLGISLYAVEMANLALMHMRVSQAALNLADAASRIDIDSGLINQTLREADINNVLAGARTYGANWGLTTRGRITIFSLEKKSGQTQYIHWERCLGMMGAGGTTEAALYEGHYDTSYGALDPADGTTTNSGDQGVSQPNGLGDNNKVSAPDGRAVIFVEVNYNYKPVVSTSWLPGGSALIHYTASYLVRDRRDLTQVYNPSPAATESSCAAHTA